MYRIYGDYIGRKRSIVEGRIAILKRYSFEIVFWALPM
jgi:hypothetical protein